MIYFVLQEQEHHADVNVQSIFSEASAQSARDPHTFHIITSAGNTSR